MENRERSRIRDTSAQDQVLNAPSQARKQNRKHWILGGLAAAVVIAVLFPPFQHFLLDSRTESSKRGGR